MDVQNQPWPKNFQEPGDLLGKSDDNPKTRWMSVNELVNGDLPAINGDGDAAVVFWVWAGLSQMGIGLV